MNKKTPLELTLLATSIAVELAKGKNKDEICELRTILYQIYTTLQTLCNLK